MIIDTHTHCLGDKEFDYFLFFKENPGHFLIISGFDMKSNRKVLEVIDKYPNIYGTIGFHPSETDNFNNDDLAFLKKNASNSKIVAIGEIGLDYHYDVDNKEKQQEAFKKQLNLAIECSLPVVIHNRDANEDVFNILKKYELNGIMHCFLGNYEQATQYIELGYMIGIGGVVTFKNSKLKDVVYQVDIDNITIETDVPYLSPEPYRGKENKYKNIGVIIDKIADIKEVLTGDVENKTTLNALQIFDKIDIK